MIRKLQKRVSWLRRLAIVNGIIQSTLHSIFVILMIVTLKINLVLKEKQVTDLMDHGADADHMNNRNDLPDSNDINKLWVAKVQNDVRIDLSTYLLVWNICYTISCMLALYACIIKDIKTMAVFLYCILIGINIFMFLILGKTFLFKFTDMYQFQWQEQHVKIHNANIDITTIVMTYLTIAMLGHMSTLLYLKNLDKLRRLTRNTEMVQSPNDENNTMTSSLNPIKQIVNTIKYLHTKRQTGKPTAV